MSSRPVHCRHSTDSSSSYNSLRMAGSSCPAMALWESWSAICRWRGNGWSICIHQLCSSPGLDRRQRPVVAGQHDQAPTLDVVPHQRSRGETPTPLDVGHQLPELPVRQEPRVQVQQGQRARVTLHPLRRGTRGHQARRRQTRNVPASAGRTGQPTARTLTTPEHPRIGGEDR
ncbi:hypothetical protein JOF35_002546 [Streptomyces demainii]|uniref:Uncharacterized protein n=1 Tax=Streptomyces demainii TaxID=588122 RepID=A0ABT9KP97_9ACTN|nr:hypothetical protein [Streptomyces demainii]